MRSGLKPPTLHKPAKLIKLYTEEYTRNIISTPSQEFNRNTTTLHSPVAFVPHNVINKRHLQYPNTGYPI